MNIGILGTGNIARIMAETVNLAHGVKLYAIASRDLKKAESFKKEFNVSKAYGSYLNLLEDENVELVYIATPHSTHFNLIMLSIDHNKPVLCEKSFTTNSALATKALLYAKEKNVFVSEAIWTRYMPSRKKLDEILASKVIGEPYLVEANLGYPIKDVPRITDRNLAGGALLDVGVYPINFSDMVYKEKPIKIEASCTYTNTNVDKTDFITFTYENDKKAILHATIEGLTSRNAYIYGPLGYIKVININNPEQISVFISTLNKTKTYTITEEINGYEYELYEAVKMIKEGKIESESMPHSETIKIMEYMDLIRKQFKIKYPFE